MRLAMIALLVTVAMSRGGRPVLEALHPVGAVQMSGVEGRIDHLAVDVAGKRLFVAALGNNTVEVVDVTGLRVTKSIKGLDEPQGIRFLADRNRIVVANGGSGATLFFDGGTMQVVQTVKLSGDADNVRYDAQAHRVYVGYAGGALAILDPDGKRLGDVKLAGHPESFQLETSGRRIFVNVPTAGHIAVVDRDKQVVTSTWPVTAAGSNYPMALDEANHRLFVGCRRPATLLVYDTVSGKLVTTTGIVGDTDDLFYDGTNKRLYVIGGEGFVTVLEQSDLDHYRTIQKLPTAAGARTGLFVPELKRLFVAVPHRGSQGTEIRIFETES